MRTTSFDSVRNGSRTLQCDLVEIKDNNASNLFAHKINVIKASERTNSFQASLCESCVYLKILLRASLCGMIFC